jgi:hypothetical protein
MATLGYGTVGSNRLTEAKAFYDALFESVGIKSVSNTYQVGSAPTATRNRPTQDPGLC